MSTKYGNIDHSKPKPRKPRQKSVIVQNQIEDDKLTPEALERHLGTLAYNKRAPSVAVRAATELLERKAPRSKNPEERLTADDVRRICDIYDRIPFIASKCPHCGKALAQ